MSNLKMILSNTADEAVLTAVPAEAIAVQNLQDERRGVALRSTGTTQVINGNHSELETVEGCVLDRHNLTHLATIRLRLFDGPDQTGNLVWDSLDVLYGDLIPAGDFAAGIDPFGGSYHTPPIAILWFAAKTFRSFSITLVDDLNPKGYLQVGRLIMGMALSPATNFSWGCRLTFVDASERARTAAMGLRTRKEDRYRRLEVSFDHLDGMDRNRFSSEIRASNGRDVLVSAYPDETGIKLSDYTMVAQIVGDVPFTNDRRDNSRLPLVFEGV